MSLPVVPLYGVELGASGLLLGLIVSVRWGARLVTDIPAGLLSERMGRRELYIVGIVFASASGVASALAADPVALLLARVLEGVGAGMSTTVALAMVADSSTGQNRGRMLGHYQAAQRIGFWLGPVAGGALAAALGLRASIWAYALLATLAIVPALFVRESRARGSAHAAPSLSAMRDLFRSRDFVLISVVSFVVFFTMTGAQFTALPLFADQELRLGPELIGVALFASSTVGVLAIYPSGILSDRYGRRAVVVGLALAGGAGLLLLVLVGDAVGLVLASLVLGGSNALRGPAMQAYVIDAGGGRSHGATAGVFRALGDLGSTVGPAVAALMFGLGYRPFFLVNATIVIVAALLFWRYASARPGEAATTAPAPLPAPRAPSRSPSR